MADLNDRNNLGMYRISTKLQEYEVARSNFFTFIVDDLEDLLYPQFSYTGENADNEYVTKRGVRDGSEVIKLSVNTATVPHFKLGSIPIKRGNSVVNFADTPTWDAGQLELNDFVGLDTKSVLMAWQALAYDVVSDTQGRAADWTDEDGVFHRGYKRDCTLVEYTPDHQIIRYWKMIGCWISSISESNFDEEGTGARRISVTLEYDRAIPFMPDWKFAAAE